MTVITRFAPAPTGMIHVGNIRTAIVNYLFAQKHKGLFMLRMDDTDLERGKDEYKDIIKDALSWLNLNYDIYATQSERVDQYLKAKNSLIASNRLYECFETAEELELKRKLLLSSGKPPIYDRSSLRLLESQKEEFKKQGRRPHYRFLLNDEPIIWQDLIKGELKFLPENLSDPIVIREDGSMTYMICSTVDDIEFNITHILRGEDHISNTAIQIQMFKSLGAKMPEFGHLALIVSNDGKISKRVGGFDVQSLKDQNIDPLTLTNFLSTIGTSKPISHFTNQEDIIDNFDINSFSVSPTNYNVDELYKLNHKIISHYSFTEVEQKLRELGASSIDERFWLTIRGNLNFLKEAVTWWKICNSPEGLICEDKEYLDIAANLFPEGEINENTWKDWIDKLTNFTHRKGKDLFMPLRLAITGMTSGPELQNLLPLIGREEIIRRLRG